MNSKALDCRAAAALCIAAVSNGSSLSQQIPHYETQVKERDRALFRQLCYGVLRTYPKLAAIVAQLLSKSLKQKDADIFCLLLVGIYQLSEMRVPDHAAVSTTVAATRALKKTWARGLTNAVLRQWQRRHTELLGNLTEAQQQAHPQWLHQAIGDAWPEHVVGIENANNCHPPMCLRINHQQLNRVAYLQLLQAAGLAASHCDYASEGIRLQEPVKVELLPGFSAGQVSVQDEAPQLAAALLQAQAEHRVLDACAAPGGKACHLLELLPDLQELVALDIDEQRLQRVNENLVRLQLQATLVTGDAAQTNSWWDGQLFDRILLDAPCSATGVIRRNPDIKLHRTANDIAKLAALQWQIINALWTTLKPGGRMLYATCSILPAENEQIVQRFCTAQDDARSIAITADWGVARDYGRQLFPQVDGHDGFYYALIEKTPTNNH